LRKNQHTSNLSEEYNFAAVYPEKAKLWHPTKNRDLRPEEFLPMSNQKAYWQCNFGHEFFVEISSVARSNNNGCRKCSSQSSAPEVRILAELEYIFSEVLSRLRIDKKEIDIYIPELRIGIEYDGAHWHKSREEIDNKKNLFLKKQNISLIRVRELPLQKISKYDICVSQNNITKEDINRIVEIIKNFAKKKYNDEINAYLSSNNFLNEELYKTYLSCFPSPLPQNALSKTHKELSMEWDYEKNHPLRPNNFTSGSHYSAWWSCKNKSHPSFPQQIKSRALRGHSCPYCSNQSVIYEDSIAYLYPKISKQWNYKKNDKLPEEIPKNSGYVAWWICPLKGCEYQKVVRHRTIKKQDCTECFGIKNRKSHKKNIPGHGNKYSKFQIDFFENGLSHLKSYLEQHNDIYKMTISFVSNDGFRLGGWVNKQISKKNTMSKERFNTLNSLRGWTWSKGNDFAFEKGIKYLIEYLEIHLSMDELKSNHLAPDGYTLGRWVSKKRAQRDTMCKERRKALESVKGWDWNNPRKPKET
jgi:very-short-patch-repair endonuclease